MPPRQAHISFIFATAYASLVQSLSLYNQITNGWFVCQTLNSEFQRDFFKIFETTFIPI